MEGEMAVGTSVWSAELHQTGDGAGFVGVGIDRKGSLGGRARDDGRAANEGPLV